MRVIEDLQWFYKTLDIGGKTAEFYESQKDIILQSLVVLEKQIPKEPIDKIMYKECPKCGSVEFGRYCMECGQAIKWE